jgi:hypothetical protein
VTNPPIAPGVDPPADPQPTMLAPEEPEIAASVPAVLARVRRRPLGGWFVVGAGIAIIAGGFLPWVTVLGTASSVGVDTPYGWVAVAAGTLIVLFGSLVLDLPWFSVALPITSVVACLAAVAWAAWRIVELHQSMDELRRQISDDDLGIGQAMGDLLHATVGPGLWLIIYAGVVGAIAASTIRASRYPS